VQYLKKIAQASSLFSYLAQLLQEIYIKISKATTQHLPDTTMREGHANRVLYSKNTKPYIS
jgi:hypothetical protein